MRLTNRQARGLHPGDLLVLDIDAGLGNQKLPKGAYFVVKEVDDDLEMKVVFFGGFFPDYPKVTENLLPGYKFNRSRFRFPTEKEIYEWTIRRQQSQQQPQQQRVLTFNNPLAALRGVLPDVYGREENQRYRSNLRARQVEEELDKKYDVYVALTDVEAELTKPLIDHTVCDHAARENEQHEELRRHDQKYGGVK